MSKKTVYLNSKKISLDDNDFLAAGGQAEVYAKNNLAFKIYHSVNEVCPEQKIKELSVLTNPQIVKPENLLYSDKTKLIGYTMKLLPETYSLCQLFPKIFKLRNNLKNDKLLDLIRKLQNIIKEVHKSKILIIDLNELNILVNKDFSNLNLIDVDSYQTKSFPATVIMDNIRDWQASSFSELTDWYSFGILSFQLLTSIHPFRGKHPRINALKDRMLQNISVFDSEVKMPPTVTSFSFIPEVYKNWYISVFQQGNRSEPPTDLTVNYTISHISTKNLSSQDQTIEYELWERFADSIIEIRNDENQFFINCGKIFSTSENPQNFNLLKFEFLPIKIDNEIVQIGLDQKEIGVYSLLDRQTNLSSTKILAQDLRLFESGVYFKQADKIALLTWMKNGNKLFPLVKLVANVLPQASKFYDNCVVQDVYGSWVINIFPVAGASCTLRLKELDGFKILDAKYCNQVLVVSTYKNGKYSQFLFRFNQTHSQYDVKFIDDLNCSTINFTTIKGNVVIYQVDNKLQLFRNEPFSSELKEIVDDNVSKFKLFGYQNKLYGIEGNKIFNLKLKA